MLGTRYYELQAKMVPPLAVRYAQNLWDKYKHNAGSQSLANHDNLFSTSFPTQLAIRVVLQKPI